MPVSSTPNAFALPAVGDAVEEHVDRRPVRRLDRMPRIAEQRRAATGSGDRWSPRAAPRRPAACCPAARRAPAAAYSRRATRPSRARTPGRRAGRSRSPPENHPAAPAAARSARSARPPTHRSRRASAGRARRRPRRHERRGAAFEQPADLVDLREQRLRRRVRRQPERERRRVDASSAPAPIASYTDDVFALTLAVTIRIAHGARA